MAGSSSIMDSLFQRSLEDLIKGQRLQLVGESTFISKALEEIRHEIKSTDPQTKSTALQKLTYLHSLHAVDISWAAFHAVELSSSPRFHHKKIAYLAASLSFHSATDVLLLLTNQLRKDLSGANPFEVCLALECLSLVCNSDLATDLTPELFTLLSSTKTIVRKKAIATLLRVFSTYPDAVRVCFKRLVENLEGGNAADLQTVSAAVGLFCELTAKDPKTYLPLAPEFYRILVDSRNNWVLIKVLKIFAKLAVLEPRLAKRIVEPICEHMRRTGAKSLVFECVRTIMTSLSEYDSAVKLAVVKIREFLIDDDPNLKYLGLQALLIAAPRHLWAVLENKEVVIKSLSDEDPNIKLEALRLVMAMVCEDNVPEICKVLVNYALKSDPEFCNEILGSILSTCCRNVYEMVVDFDWYVSLLGEMLRIPHCRKGEEIESQLIDIGMRVEDVRPELVRVSRDLLIDPALLGNPFLHRILSAAAWVSGEYAEFSNNPSELMEALLQPRTSLLPPLIRSVYIQSAFKVLVFCLHSCLLPNEAVASSFSCPIDQKPGITGLVRERESSDLATCEAPANSEQGEQVEQLSVDNDGYIVAVHGQTSSLYTLKKDYFEEESIVSLLDIIETAFGQLSGSHEVEIQERARNVLGFVELIQKVIRGCAGQKDGISEKEEMEACEIINLMSGAFSEDLGPVSCSAQGRVPVPDGILLTDNLRDLDIICGYMLSPKSSPFSLGRSLFGERDDNSILYRDDQEDSVPSTESTSLLAEHRKRHGLYYLSSEKKEVVSNDYPLANDSKLRDNVSDDTDNLVKLTEQSLIVKKKPTQTKPRPVVVKLDGDDIPITVKKPESEGDMISVAVRDVLLGNEAIPTSSGSKPSKKSSSKRRGKEIMNIDEASQSKDNLNVGKSEHENQSSRRSKHSPQGKERKHRSPGKDGGEREENGEKFKQKSSHRHGRHKGRQRADGGVNAAAQTPIIPDYLL